MISPVRRDKLKLQLREMATERDALLVELSVVQRDRERTASLLAQVIGIARTMPIRRELGGIEVALDKLRQRILSLDIRASALINEAAPLGRYDRESEDDRKARIETRAALTAAYPDKQWTP